MTPPKGTDPRRIIFLNRYFYPDDSGSSQMVSGIAFGLAEQGQKVIVIASRMLYNSPGEQLPEFEITRGVEVHRIWTTRFGRYNLIGRFLDYLTFYFASALRLWRLGKTGDVFVVKTDPPMLSVVVAPIANLRHALLVNWLQDIFPEVASRLRFSRGIFARFANGQLRALRNMSLHRADANIAIGEHMRDHLLAIGVAASHIQIIPNWADGNVLRPVPHDANPRRALWAEDGGILVAYSGNLGRVHDYITILDAIGVIEKRQNEQLASVGSATKPTKVSWIFIGGGVQYGALRREVIARGYNSVQFEPYQPTDQLCDSLSAADIHLVSMLPEFEGLVVPSKIYGIAAVGRPTIFVGAVDGEIARLIDRNKFGLTVAAGDVTALADAIAALAQDPELRRLLGENARAAFERSFDLYIAVSRWQRLLTTIDPKGSFRE